MSKQRPQRLDPANLTVDQMRQGLRATRAGWSDVSDRLVRKAWRNIGPEGRAQAIDALERGLPPIEQQAPTARFAARDPQRQAPSSDAGDAPADAGGSPNPSE